MPVSTGRIPIAVSVGAIAIVAATILHIGDLKRQVRELREDRETLTLSVITLEAASEEAETAARTLQREVERFAYENWRDVVGDVQNATEEVIRTAEEVSAAVEAIRP